MNVLVTGGAGYIGSHAALRLLRDGHAVTVIDDLSRGNRGAVEVLAAAGGDLHFVRASVGDRPALDRILPERRIDLVMHFAALAYVGESVEVPLRYYRANLADAVTLLEAMDAAGVDRMVFSSSCATYGQPPPELVPINESCPQRPVNPYGRSKLAVEHMLDDHRRARGGRFTCATLRYFNVAGCGADGLLGEDHRPETHLIPVCLEAALGLRESVTIFGTDYDTPDGTCIRDYVHVDDLIDAHVTVMAALQPGDGRAYNIGIGGGSSVRQVIDSCRRVTGADLPAVDGPRRPGDPPALYADPGSIEADLGWSAAVTDLDRIVETAWRWRREHPEGYGGS